jgi:FkbM family methyltransferase
MLDVRTQGSYWLGTYDRWILQRVPLKRFLRPGDTAWDCGAFVGYYTAIFRKLVGNTGFVFSFEASSQNYLQVTCIPKLNQWSNLAILNLAVGPDHTAVKFAAAEGGASGPIGLVHGVREHISSGVEDVQSCGVDELVYEKGVRQPHFIKFDLETGEIFALNNGHRLFAEARPYILLELHGEAALQATLKFIEYQQYLAAPVHELPKIREHNDRNSFSLWSRIFEERAQNFRSLPPHDYPPHMLFLIAREKLEEDLSAASQNVL